MVLYNKKHIPANWNNFSSAINPNIIRGFDAYNNFALKYPLATIHLLMCIVGTTQKIPVPKSAITCLMYVDGTFKSLLNYPENCISWLKYLNAKDEKSPLFPMLLLFAQQKISTMMHDLEKIFEEFRKLADGKRGGDKIKILTIQDGNFPTEIKNKNFELISFLSALTGWELKSTSWTQTDMKVINFQKEIIPVNTLNNKKYDAVLHNNPVSFAITGTKQMEYTFDKDGELI